MVIFLMGLIVVGKIDLVILLCEYLNIEIISVDLVLVYKDMDIGIVKLNVEEFVCVLYYLIDIIDFVESYLVVDFCCDVIEKIDLFYK